MTVGDLKRFYSDKDEHYEISDRFVKDGYQQTNDRPNTYIGTAKNPEIAEKDKVIIDQSTAEPNQKWHLLRSYCRYHMKDDNDAKVRQLLCPELVLWMAEAAGIDKKVIDEAEKEARRIIDNGKDGNARTAAAREIIKMIGGWGELEKIIMGK